MTDTNIHPQALSIPTGARMAAIIPRTMEEAWRLGQAICRAGWAPRGMETPDKCALAIMHGLEVGLMPMQAVQSMSVINGRPGLGAEVALALVRSSGRMEYIREAYVEATEVCRCTVKRKGEPALTRTFSKADAITAGLWGRKNKDGSPTPWVAYPKRMLQMRARGFALRDGFPDVLKGMPIAEELADIGETHVAPNGGPPAMVDPPISAEIDSITEAGEPVSQEEIDAANELFAEQEAELQEAADAKHKAQMADLEPEDDGLGIPVGLRRTR